MITQDFSKLPRSHEASLIAALLHDQLLKRPDNRSESSLGFGDYTENTGSGGVNNRPDWIAVAIQVTLRLTRISL